jgi:hypothetical protein
LTLALSCGREPLLPAHSVRKLRFKAKKIGEKKIKKLKMMINWAGKAGKSLLEKAGEKKLEEDGKSKKQLEKTRKKKLKKAKKS